MKRRTLAVDEFTEGGKLDETVSGLAIAGEVAVLAMQVALQHCREERHLDIQPAFASEHCMDSAPQAARTDSDWDTGCWGSDVRRFDDLKNTSFLVDPIVMLCPVTYVRVSDDEAQTRYGDVEFKG